MMGPLEPRKNRSWARTYSGRSAPNSSKNATAITGTSMAISPPEWFETISAPPSGTFSIPVTSDRNQPRTASRSRGISPATYLPSR